MNEEDLIRWVESLPPQMQASMLQMVLGMGEGQFPVNPNQGIAPPTAYQYVPELDKRGNIMPWDIDVARDNLNYQQDIRGDLFDPVLTAMAGPGAFAPGTFEPRLLNEAQMNAARPGQNMLANAANLDPTSYDGFVAEALATGQAQSAADAHRLFWHEASAVNEDGTPTETAQMLLDSLPQLQVQDDRTGEYVLQPDRNAPLEFAQTIQTELLKDTEVAPIYGYSEAAQNYIDQGLPFPTERYGEGSYSMEAQIPGYAEASEMLGGATQRVKDTRRTRDSAQSDLAAMERRMAQEKATEDYRRVTSGANQPPGEILTKALRPGPEIDIGPNMQLDTGNYGVTMGIGPNIPGLGYVGGEMQIAEPQTSRPILDDEGEPMRRAGGPVTSRGPALALERRANATSREADRAKKERRALYRQVNGPEAVYARRRDEEMNRQGRTPLNDALMQRQIALYLTGAYGPRG